jgi:hypothetical protein
MKRFAAVLIVTLTILALPGCVQDKPAPRLDSPHRNERIEAVRQAQNKYGVPAKPAENKPAQPPPVSAVMQVPRLDDVIHLPIDGRWIIKATQGEQSIEAEATIENGKLTTGSSLYWKNIHRVPNAPSRYSAVRVSRGIIWDTREDPVEFYLDADGILHQDDTQLPSLLRSVGTFTLRRP